MNNNNILFDNDNSNDELIRENTPTTVDYNKLYNNQNTGHYQQNTELNISNEQQILDNKQFVNINETVNNNYRDNINSEFPQQKKKGISSLLFVFILFLIIMTIVILIFPWLSKSLL